MTRFNAFDVEALNARFADEDAEAILDFALETFGGALAFACSLGLEDAALVEMISRREERPRSFFLDTGRLHPETYGTLHALQARYGVAIETYFPEAAAVEAFVNAEGIDAFYGSLELRKACCAIRKVEPLKRALKGADAWITGLRREQAATRSDLGPFELDWANGGILKVNPLIAWSYERVRAYARERDIPVNPLHEKGYPSLGCAPCTRPVGPGEDLRAGRWWWEQPEHKECGLHAAHKERP
jgi:phosphoadenosine phosphosulfate reductase